MAIPFVGHVVVLGYLATIAIAGLENAVIVGGLSALGAALYSIGVPKDSVLQYETAVKADGFLIWRTVRRQKWLAQRQSSVQPIHRALT